MDEKLLLAEYQNFYESLWRNEETGEKRINFFISLTTAILAGVVTLSTSKEIDESLVQQISTLILVGNFVFGLVTFVRILWRNKVTDEYKKVLDDLRKEMKNRSESLGSYELPLMKPQTKQKWKFKGGLADMVAVMNSILLTALIGIWVDAQFKWVTILVFWGSLLLQFVIVYYARKKPKDEKQKNETGT